PGLPFCFGFPRRWLKLLGHLIALFLASKCGHRHDHQQRCESKLHRRLLHGLWAFNTSSSLSWQSPSSSSRSTQINCDAARETPRCHGLRVWGVRDVFCEWNDCSRVGDGMVCRSSVGTGIARCRMGRRGKLTGMSDDGTDPTEVQWLRGTVPARPHAHEP